MIGGIQSLLTKRIIEPTQTGSPTKATPMTDWATLEDEMNKRMNIVGSNGNDGHHYWEESWNEEYED